MVLCANVKFDMSGRLARSLITFAVKKLQQRQDATTSSAAQQLARLVPQAHNFGSIRHALLQVLHSKQHTPNEQL
jgi:hypothetical protein